MLVADKENIFFKLKILFLSTLGALKAEKTSQGKLLSFAIKYLTLFQKPIHVCVIIIVILMNCNNLHLINIPG